MQFPSDGVSGVVLTITISTFLGIVLEIYTQQGMKKRDRFRKEPDSKISGFGSWYANHVISSKQSMIFHSVEYTVLSVVFIGLVVFFAPQMHVEIIGFLIILALIGIILRGTWGYVSFQTASERHMS